LGGLKGADKICQDLATSAGLPGKYMAWLSNETTSPATRFSQSTLPYVLVDGTQIATDWKDLTDGSLAAPITVDENLQTSYGKVVWSNTKADGSQYDDRHHCDNWLRTLPDVDGVETGKSHLTNSAWSLAYLLYTCNSTLRIYCFEQ